MTVAKSLPHLWQKVRKLLISKLFLSYSCILQKNEYGRDLYWHFPAYLQSYKKSGKNWRATPYSSIRSGDWKLIYYYEDKSVELFNLKNDLSEEHDLSQTHSDKKKELYTKLMDWLRQTRAPIPTQPNPDYVAEK